MLRRLLLTVGTLLVLVPIATAGQGKAKGKGKPAAPVTVEIFVAPDRAMLHEYFGKHTGGLPPGLVRGNGELPPGLEKQLRKKGHLPPGLEKKLVPFPLELEARLAPLAPGLERGFIAGRAVIINSSTRLILDVFVPLP